MVLQWCVFLHESKTSGIVGFGTIIGIFVLLAVAT